jgi:hypothetical protein
MKISDLIAGVPKADLEMIIAKIKADPNAMSSVRNMSPNDAIKAISRFSADEITEAFKTIKSVG